MSNFFKDIRLNNMPSNMALALDENGIIKTTNVNINDVASASETQNTLNIINMNIQNVTNLLNNSVSNISNDINKKLLL